MILIILQVAIVWPRWFLMANNSPSATVQLVKGTCSDEILASDLVVKANFKNCLPITSASHLQP